MRRSMRSTGTAVLRGLTTLSAMLMLSACASLSIDVDVYKHSSQVDRAAIVQEVSTVLNDPVVLMDSTAREGSKVDFANALAQQLIPLLHPQVDGLDEAQTNVLKIRRRTLLDDMTYPTGALGHMIGAAVAELWYAPVDRLRQRAFELRAALERSPAVSDATLNLSHQLMLDASEQVEAAPAQLRRSVLNVFASHPRTSSLTVDTSTLVASSISRTLLERSDLASGIASQAEVSGRVVGYPVFDPEVSQLAVDNASWSPFIRNRFKVAGGNAQFVVVREGSVVFHKKSLDFDPSSAISTAQAAADIALNIAGAMATGKITTTTRGSEGEPDTYGTDTVLSLAELETGKDSLARNRVLMKELLLRLAELAERADQAGIGVDALKADFDAIVQTHLAKSGAVP